MAQITGHIVQANGLPISEAVIVVTAVGHSNVVGGNIFKGTSFDVVCGTDGGYSFQLAVGSYSIQVKIGRTSVALDGVVVDNDTPDGIDILQLVAYDGVSVALAQQILNEATALSIAQETAVVSAILNNDGVGSGLDADLLQGKTLDEVLSTPTPPLLITSSSSVGNAGKWTKLLKVSALDVYDGGAFLFSLTSITNLGGSVDFTVNLRTDANNNMDSLYSGITVTEQRNNFPMNKFKMVSNGVGSFEVWVQVNDNYFQSILSVGHNYTERQGNIEFFSNQPWVVEPVGTVLNKHSIDEINLNQGMDTGWILPTLTNGWVSHPAPYPFLGFRKMPDGTVVMGGLIKGGATTSYHAICTLPLGYRPSTNIIFSVRVNLGTHAIEIYPNGLIVFRNQGTGSPSSWLSFSGISFPTN